MIGLGRRWEPPHERLELAIAVEIAAALDGWAAGCLPLCFAAPRADTLEEGAQLPDGSIHFGPSSAGVPSDGVTTLFYRRDEGRIAAAHVGVGPDFEAGALASEVGHALGLQNAPPGTESVMAAAAPRPAAPTCVDLRSICAVY